MSLETVQIGDSRVVARWHTGFGRVDLSTLRMRLSGPSVDDLSMAQQQRLRTYDDELHERRRRLSVVREPIDFQAERLKRLVERARDTQDP